MFDPESAVNETRYPGKLAKGAKGGDVRRLQEWLSLQGNRIAIDDDFGDATERALSTFQLDSHLPVTGTLDAATWARLVAPMVAALSARPASASLPEALLEIGREHLAQHPLEVGGDNRGPWVRLYMSGSDGAQWRWCAGFVSFLVKQACNAVPGAHAPVSPTFSCDTLAQQAAHAGRLKSGDDLASGKLTWADVGPVSIFLCRRSPGDWSHTGIAYQGAGTTFVTLEGNTNDDGSCNGYEVCARTRSVAGKDFISLQ
jgi:hypothetical protein